MRLTTSRVVQEIALAEYHILMTGKALVVSPHILDILDNAQRKVFNEQELIRIVENETPRRIGLQQNGRYSVYYRRSWGHLRVIIRINHRSATIVTFVNSP